MTPKYCDLAIHARKISPMEIKGAAIGSLPLITKKQGHGNLWLSVDSKLTRSWLTK